MSESSIASERRDAPLVAHDGVEIDGTFFVPMLSSVEIASAIERIAGEIARRHADRVPIVTCLLNGAAPFHADLVRRLPFPLETAYIGVSSYRGGSIPSGKPTITTPLSTQLQGRDVIVVDDIVDTGATLETVIRYILGAGASSVTSVALLYKADVDTHGRPPDHIGFRIPNVFVVGYGLDFRGLGRNLPGIYRMATRRLEGETESAHAR